jgi:hypothetical protein
MAQSLGTDPGQDQRGGRVTMGVLTELPMTTTWITTVGRGTMGETELPMTMTRITIVGRECVCLLQWTVINRAGGGPDAVPGVWLVMIQAMMSAISRGVGEADHQPLWVQGPE